MLKLYGAIKISRETVGCCTGPCPTVDRAWVEEALSFPGVGPLVQELAPVDPLAVFAVVKGFGIEFATACKVRVRRVISCDG